MPLKEKSVFKKSEYEYESPDGDKYSVTVIETGERKYVEVTRQNIEGEPAEPPVRWDVEMVHAIDDILRKVTRQPNVPISYGRGLSVPNITDLRTGNTGSQSAPIESFSPDQNEEEDGSNQLLPWQKEAEQRKSGMFMPKQNLPKIKKVSAKDVM